MPSAGRLALALVPSSSPSPSSSPDPVLAPVLAPTQGGGARGETGAAAAAGGDAQLEGRCLCAA